MSLQRQIWSSRTSSYGVYLGLLVFTLTALFLGFEIRQNRTHHIVLQRGPSSVIIDLSALSRADLMKVTDHSQYHFVKSSKPAYHLVVFLSAADCSSCLETLVLWQPILRRHDLLNTDGSLVFVDSSDLEIRQATEMYSRDFVILNDYKTELARSIRLPETPLTVLLDADLVPVASLGPSNSVAATAAFIRRVQTLVVSQSLNSQRPDKPSIRSAIGSSAVGL